MERMVSPREDGFGLLSGKPVLTLWTYDQMTYCSLGRWYQALFGLDLCVCVWGGCLDKPLARTGVYSRKVVKEVT